MREGEGEGKVKEREREGGRERGKSGSEGFTMEVRKCKKKHMRQHVE